MHSPGSPTAYFPQCRKQFNTFEDFRETGLGLTSATKNNEGQGTGRSPAAHASIRSTQSKPCKVVSWLTPWFFPTGLFELRFCSLLSRAFSSLTTRRSCCFPNETPEQPRPCAQHRTPHLKQIPLYETEPHSLGRGALLFWALLVSGVTFLPAAEVRKKFPLFGVYLLLFLRRPLSAAVKPFSALELYLLSIWSLQH